VAVNGWHQSGGYDFATGRELWRHDGGGDIPVPTPITAHGLIYFTSAHGRSRPIRAVRADASGDITPKETGVLHPAVAWEHDRKGNYMQTPIVVGDIVYACNDLGLVTAFNAKTGEIHYSERLAKRSEGFTASPVSDGRHLYFTSELGNIYLVPVGAGFAVAHTNELGENTLATPAISEGVLLFRTRDKIVAVGRRP
jgi:outer membrane protein assembly factor BamB